jgi:hypothetical protein
MANIFNEDFRDFISALNNSNVKYIHVGGFAVILHGHARVTGDMDVWIEPTEENYKHTVKAFTEFGMSLFDMTKDNFLAVDKFDVVSFGRKPVSIDIMTKAKGLISRRLIIIQKCLMMTGSLFILYILMI